MSRLKQLFAGRFQRDVAWNFASLGMLAISGAALNVGIGRYYDEAALGVFNQALVAYTIASQLAAAGINLSALRRVAEKPHEDEHVRAILASSMVPTVLLASAVTVLYWFLRHPIAGWLESDGVARAIEASTPGLFFFAINKNLLGIVNGLQRMKAFALYTTLRYFGILVALIACFVADVAGDRLALVFSVAEAALFVALAFDLRRYARLPPPPGWTSWIREHITYGTKSVLAGVILELNAKVDIWMLGIYLTDGPVGVYSFAAFVAEGVFQLIVVLQQNYNPILARTFAEKRYDELHAVVRKGRRGTYLLMVPICAVATLVYPFAVSILTGREGFDASFAPFAALMIGTAIAAGWLPFAQALLMAGKPGWHTLFMALVVGTNIAGNALLIPYLGLSGAAIATAISLAASIVYLRVLVRRQTGVTL